MQRTVEGEIKREE